MRNIVLVLVVVLLFSSAQAQTVLEIYPNEGDFDDRFGDQVSICGDYVLVSADGDDDCGNAAGAAYIFVRDYNVWIEYQKLTPEDLATMDGFGLAVSINSNYAIIGSPYDDDLGNWSGSAYIYNLEGNTWIEQQKLTPGDGDTEDLFGYEVALDGDYAIIGTREGYDNGWWDGSAYIFRLEGDEWIEQVKLVPNDLEPLDKFACSVSIDGDYAVVGACLNDEADLQAGAAYVFKRTTDRIQETWFQQQKLIADDVDYSDAFGKSVAISGDYIIVGSICDDDQGLNSGSAYIFKLEENEWVQQQKIWGSEVGPEDSFGEKVAISGNRAIVGARRDDDHGSNSGAAYVFELIDDVWTETHKLTAYDGFTLDLFGVAVAIDGDRTIVGTRGYHPITGLWTGTAYIYDFSPENPIPVTLTPQNPPVMIPAAGGSFTYDIEIINFFNYAVQPSIWLVAERPRQFTQLIQVQALYIPPADTISTTLTQFVPDIAPHGHYHFIADLGDWADSVIISEDHFDFVKFPGDALADDHRTVEGPGYLDGHFRVARDARVARIAGQVGFHHCRPGSPNPANRSVARNDRVARLACQVGFRSDGWPGVPASAGCPGFTVSHDDRVARIACQVGFHNTLAENPRTVEGPGYLDGHIINPVCEQTGPPIAFCDGWDVLGWDLLCGELASGVDDMTPDRGRSGLHPSDMKPKLASNVDNPHLPGSGTRQRRINPAYTMKPDLTSKSGHPYPPGSENPAYLTSKQDHALLPLEFSLEPAWPNPFNPSTTVTIALPEATSLRIAVFNTLGREVAVLADSHFPSGHHHFTFNAGRDLPAWIYFIHAAASSGWSEVQKVVLVR